VPVAPAAEVELVVSVVGFEFSAVVADGCAADVELESEFVVAAAGSSSSPEQPRARSAEAVSAMLPVASRLLRRRSRLDIERVK
jgi:hypothetical protein